ALRLPDLEAGILKLQRAVELGDTQPSSPRLRLAEALLARGRLDEAEEHFREVLRHEPNNPRARLGLGRLAVFRDDFAGSLEPLRAARGSPYPRKAPPQPLAEGD